MAIPRKNPPKANILMDSMRAMGYTFETALADVIDNSVSAGASEVYIEFPKEPTDCYVAVCDNGRGMTSDGLFEAMKYGSNVSNGVRTEEDLGRFGLGLKAASLSQCRKLTVVSKLYHETSAYSWDLDYVEKESEEWSVLQLEEDEISQLQCINYFDTHESGTIVLWQNFDVIQRTTGDVFSSLDEYKEKASNYLSLIFHRYLNNKQMNIKVNNFKLKGYDPFLEDHKKTNKRKEIILPIEDSQGNEKKISIIPYVLPFQKDLSKDDIKLMGGADNSRTKQGFYIYRNKRLIIWGTWFGMPKNELTKNARVRVDIPNTLDDIWNIDIKKQNATIPKKITNQLKKAVEEAMNLAIKSQTYRGRVQNISDDFSYIWDRVEERGKYIYKINRNSAAFEFLKGEEIADSIISRFEMVIEEIEKSIPYHQIYIDMSGNNVADVNDKDRMEEVYSDAEYLIDLYKSMGESDLTSKVEKMFKKEPYCKYPQLKDRMLKGGR